MKQSTDGKNECHPSVTATDRSSDRSLFRVTSTLIFSGCCLGRTEHSLCMGEAKNKNKNKKREKKKTFMKEKKKNKQNEKKSVLHNFLKL